MLLAHSSDPERKIPAQGYFAHVSGTVERAARAAEEAGQYALRDGELLRCIIPLAAEFHDLGKLDEKNQEVLSGKTTSRKLPVQHTDAGTAYLLDKLGLVPGAVLVRSHHIGLPDFIEEKNRCDNNVLRDEAVRKRVDHTLYDLVRLHNKAGKAERTGEESAVNSVQGDPSLFFRIALSCLADGDHSDTATHYRKEISGDPFVPLQPKDRLAMLDQYVNSLKTDDDRSHQRSEVYWACRNSDMQKKIVCCGSPVGTGKTTAVMAHLLAQAEKRNLRKIIVVLPFTSIITQSVKVYRKALVLPGENPELVVAELHHLADFQDLHSRQFTALWKAPIIITTAVSFFETIASNTPASLRRLHNLPGSAISIDEAHAALPAKLLPLAWQWINVLAKEWSCYWVLASGSLNRFWKIEEFDKGKPDIPEILPTELCNRLAIYEKNRITYRYNDKAQSVEKLVIWVKSLPGPRIVVLNTVQSAAVVAQKYACLFQRSSVEHLSTALTPIDREKTLARIKLRLSDPKDTDWTLIATSCVEAGVDLSFKTGVREAASLVSLLQTAGRVNRHHPVNAETVWTIILKEDGLLNKNPAMEDSARILVGFLSERTAISPELCTNALKREIRLAGPLSDKLLKSENQLRFPKVKKDFRVIASDTRVVVIGEDLINRLEQHQWVDWRDIQKSSVQIWGYRLENLRIPEIVGHPGMYKWVYLYDNFIGYMAGVLSVEEFKQGDAIACVI